MTAETDRELGLALPCDSIAQRVFLNLWRTYDLLKAIEDGLLADFALSAQQYNVLRILRARHPQRVPTMQLSKQLISRSPDITRLLDRLEQQDWVKRERPPANRRTVEVGIRPLGLRLLAKLDQKIVAMHERQLGHLSEKEMTQLIALLRLARKPHEEPNRREPLPHVR